MVQAPFQSDGLQIEPASGQTLTIKRDATTGSLRFVDALITTGINLQDLASFSAIDGVRVVGRAGSGAKYLTVQSALDSIPTTSSANTPYVIVCLPGLYLENIVISKDGIAIVGIGQASIIGVSNLPTVTIQAAVTTTPLTTLIQGMKIQTSFAGKECVLIQGGAGLTVGNSGIRLQNCNLAAKGVGSYTCRADIVNYVSMIDCVSDESDASAILGISQCASFLVSGGTHPATQADYTTAGAVPATAGSAYVFEGCRSIGTTLSTLQNAGSLKVAGCVTVGAITLNGNRTGLIQSSTVGNLVVGNTSALTLVNSKRGTVAGTGTIDEPLVSGSTVFGGTASEAVVFTVARPNATYTVLLDTGVLDAAQVTLKTPTGFTITFGVVQNTTVIWTLKTL